MAEEENDNQEQQEGGGKGGKLKAVLIALLALLFGAALGGGGAWFLLGGDSQETADNSQQEQTSAQNSGSSASGGSQGSGASTSQSAPQPGNKELYKLSGLVVNLARSERTRYLKTTVQLELNSKAAAKRAEKMKPQLKDALLILLSNHSVDELKTMQGKFDLKRQIVARLNNILGDGAVLNTYFTEFVIQ
jgi:flagellar FliL protein